MAKNLKTNINMRELNKIPNNNLKLHD